MLTFRTDVLTQLFLIYAESRPACAAVIVSMAGRPDVWCRMKAELYYTQVIKQKQHVSHCSRRQFVFWWSWRPVSGLLGKHPGNFAEDDHTKSSILLLVGLVFGYYSMKSDRLSQWTASDHPTSCMVSWRSTFSRRQKHNRHVSMFSPLDITILTSKTGLVCMCFVFFNQNRQRSIILTTQNRKLDLFLLGAFRSNWGESCLLWGCHLPSNCRPELQARMVFCCHIRASFPPVSG